MPKEWKPKEDGTLFSLPKRIVLAVLETLIESKEKTAEQREIVGNLKEDELVSLKSKIEGIYAFQLAEEWFVKIKPETGFSDDELTCLDNMREKIRNKLVDDNENTLERKSQEIKNYNDEAVGILAKKSNRLSRKTKAMENYSDVEEGKKVSMQIRKTIRNIVKSKRKYQPSR